MRLKLFIPLPNIPLPFAPLLHCVFALEKIDAGSREKGADEMKNYQTNPSLIFRFAHEQSGLLTFVISREKKRTHLGEVKAICSLAEHSPALASSLPLCAFALNSLVFTLKDCKPLVRWFNPLAV